MKFLPFTISVGKSLERMLDEKLGQEDLAHQIERMQNRGSEDKAIRRGHIYLPLIDTLYRDDVKNEHFNDKGRVAVKVYGCGRFFPNSCVASKEDFRDGRDHQFQVVVSDDALLAREVINRKCGDYSTEARVRASCIKPFHQGEGDGLWYRLTKTFIQQIFERPICNGFCTHRGREAGRADDETRKTIYEIRLIIPSETRQKYGGMGYSFVKSNLEKLGYKELQEKLEFADII